MILELGIKNVGKDTAANVQMYSYSEDMDPEGFFRKTNDLENELYVK